MELKSTNEPRQVCIGRQTYYQHQQYHIPVYQAQLVFCSNSRLQKKPIIHQLLTTYLYAHLWLYPVYTIQQVVKPVVQPV